MRLTLFLRATSNPHLRLRPSTNSMQEMNRLPQSLLLRLRLSLTVRYVLSLQTIVLYTHMVSS